MQFLEEKSVRNEQKFWNYFRNFLCFLDSQLEKTLNPFLQINHRFSFWNPPSEQVAIFYSSFYLQLSVAQVSAAFKDSHPPLTNNLPLYDVLNSIISINYGTSSVFRAFQIRRHSKVEVFIHQLVADFFSLSPSLLCEVCVKRRKFLICKLHFLCIILHIMI